jgi:hypothetical protein
MKALDNHLFSSPRMLFEGAVEYYTHCKMST